MKAARLALSMGLLLSIVAAITGIASGKEAGSEPVSHLPFQGDLDRAIELSREDGRPLFVMFVAAWCPICTEMKKVALIDPAVTAHADAMRWVMIDIDRDLTTARQWSVEAVPYIMLMNAAGEPERQIVGKRTADELQAELEAYLTDVSAPDRATSSDPSSPDRARSDLIWSPKGYRGAGICFSHVGYGPLNLYSQSPFQALRLGIRPRTPSTVGKGEREFRATVTWANTWANGDDYFLDFESLQTALALGYGITDTLQIEFELQQGDRFGGEMDPFVQGFHDLFGIDQGGRDEVPHGQFSFDSTRRVKQFYFYGTLGYAWFGRDTFRGIPLEDSQYTILAAAEWRFRANQSFLLQYLLTEGLSADFGPFTDASHEITIGWKWEVVSKTVIEIGLIENLVSFDNSPDFGIHAGVVRRF